MITFQLTVVDSAAQHCWLYSTVHMSIEINAYKEVIEKYLFFIEQFHII